MASRKTSSPTSPGYRACSSSLATRLSPTRTRASTSRTSAGDSGVRHVLEGSVRRAGMRVRINVQLIDAESGGHVWADRYDRDLEDIFLVQDEVTRKIVQILEVTLTGSERARRRGSRQGRSEAYDYLIRGRSCILQFNAGSARRSPCHVAACPGHRPGDGAGLCLSGRRRLRSNTRTAGTVACERSGAGPGAGAQGVRGRSVRGDRAPRPGHHLDVAAKAGRSRERGAAGHRTRPELLRVACGAWATCCTSADGTRRRSSRWSVRFGSTRNSTCGCMLWDESCSPSGATPKPKRCSSGD